MFARLYKARGDRILLIQTVVEKHVWEFVWCLIIKVTNAVSETQPVLCMDSTKLLTFYFQVLKIPVKYKATESNLYRFTLFCMRKLPFTFLELRTGKKKLHTNVFLKYNSFFYFCYPKTVTWSFHKTGFNIMKYRSSVYLKLSPSSNV